MCEMFYKNLAFLNIINQKAINGYTSSVARFETEFVVKSQFNFLYADAELCPNRNRPLQPGTLTGVHISPPITRHVGYINTLAALKTDKTQKH
jgi:hypothetical protein